MRVCAVPGRRNAGGFESLLRGHPFVSFVVAWAVIKAFLAVVTRYGFAPFAWYRIIVGVAALIWLGMR